VLAAASAAASSHSKASLLKEAQAHGGSKKQMFDFHSMRKEQTTTGIEASFIKINDVLSAYKTGSMRVEVLESKNELQFDEKNISEFSENPHSFYNTSTVYHLKDDGAFISLDESIHGDAVLHMDDQTSVHCHGLHSTAFKIGDMLVASATKASATTFSSKVGGRGARNHLFKNYLASERVTRNEEFSILRRVTSVSHDHGDISTLLARQLTTREIEEGNCRAYETEDLHPLELLESYEIHSNITIPYKIRNDPVPVKKSAAHSKESLSIPSRESLISFHLVSSYLILSIILSSICLNTSLAVSSISWLLIILSRCLWYSARYLLFLPLAVSSAPCCVFLSVAVSSYIVVIHSLPILSSRYLLFLCYLLLLFAVSSCLSRCCAVSTTHITLHILLLLLPSASGGMTRCDSSWWRGGDAILSGNDYYFDWSYYGWACGDVSVLNCFLPIRVG
jgi:hypothetical protein